ncbi:hypothetical protein F4781DRAFT_21516 [Annulohypoxylon bovei var. microspora]|nr:hypothetical protein F4781DRAFT_21516 [Annulohypoxylon bovei var. microspora]
MNSIQFSNHLSVNSRSIVRYSMVPFLLSDLRISGHWYLVFSYVLFRRIHFIMKIFKISFLKMLAYAAFLILLSSFILPQCQAFLISESKGNSSCKSMAKGELYLRQHPNSSSFNINVKGSKVLNPSSNNRLVLIGNLSILDEAYNILGALGVPDGALPFMIRENSFTQGLMVDNTEDLKTHASASHPAILSFSPTSITDLTIMMTS